MKKKPKPKMPEVRLTEKLQRSIVSHIKEMIEAVMAEQDIWNIIDEHVQHEYAREGTAWLELDAPATVLCSIGTGDAVFRLPLDVTMIDIDGPDAPQNDNKRRLTYLTILMADLHEVKRKLTDVLERAQKAKGS
jgi:hypothetical protein